MIVGIYFKLSEALIISLIFSFSSICSCYSFIARFTC